MDSRSPSRCPKTSQLDCAPKLGSGDSVVTVSHRQRNKRKACSHDNRFKFKLVRCLDDDTASRLDELREDLQESIDRTMRIQAAFVKQLYKESRRSNRIQHIIQVIGEIPFHCELQNKITDETISKILTSKEVQVKFREEEALEKKRQEIKDRSTRCLNCRHELDLLEEVKE